MYISRLILPLLFVLLTFNGIAQKKKSSKQNKSDRALIQSLQTHIQFLSDDKLEGRRAGTEGERLAREYIIEKFREIGVEPKGTSGYLQAFEIYEGKQINPTTHLIINGEDLKNGKDFFPFAWSTNASIEAMPSIAVQEAEMPWFLDLAEALTDNKTNPHFDVEAYVLSQVDEVKKKNATALIVYNTSDIDDKLAFNSKDRNERSAIPVIYVGKETAKKFFGDQAATLDIKLKTDVGNKARTGNNVVGFINNNAGSTIVLGAHFDHLGFGEDGNSMARTSTGTPHAIHNGADDNASGTAALIELARILKANKSTKHNYLFIAFSGEEIGLNGSKYFVDNPTIDLPAVNYMINMDMIGRLNDSSKTVTIGGIGTSPMWGDLLKTNTAPFTVRIDSSGTGPSDHTSFYRKDIPVLFFFTGLHGDYHRPTDDADKINYAGEAQIINYIYQVITRTNDVGQKLAFTKTRETQTTTSARFSVSLGVMPDYTYTGTGVRIDGVSEGRAAQKAGMKAGDIIVQLGEHNVSSVENYMQALSKFKKGDATRVKFKRGEQVIEADVQF